MNINNTSNYETTEYNLSLIKKYTINIDNGLFLLPSPTGSGKTHAIIEYIKENITNDKKFIYAIPLKNTLNDFKNKLLKNLSTEVQNKVFVLKSISDELIDWYESSERDKIFCFSDYKEFKKLLTILESYKIFKENKSLNNFDENELNKAGGLLLNKIKKQYFDYKDNKKLKDNLLKDAKILFKSLDIEKYTIILTTASKFANKINTISSSSYLWDFKKFKNALVFLDEFDSQKHYYLDSIISKSLSTSIDIIELFRLMADTFKNMTYQNKFNYDLEHFNPIKLKFEEIYNEKKLKYVIDTKLVNNELDTLPFLIDSNFSNFSFQRDSSKLYVEVDDKNEQLLIIKEKTVNSFPFSDLLKDITQVITRYIKFCINDIYKKIETYSQNDTFVKDELNLDNYANAVIHNNIKIFGLSIGDKKYTYLKNRIKNDLFLRNKFKKDLGKRKWNFYQNGFSLININKEYIASNITDIEYLHLLSTPEDLLLNASKKMMIVGISATANINSVINNFDIKYLKSNTNFYQPTENEILHMQELYLDSKHQRNRNFHIETINDDLKIKDTIREFCRRNYSSDITISSYIESLSIKEFYLRQYINFIDCYKKFLEEDKIHSMIYFSNRYIKDDFMDDNINYKYLIHLLVELINYIEPKNDHIKNLKNKIKEYGKNIIEIQKKEHIFFIEYKKETENSYENYVSNKKNEKIFVYAVYKRIGTGKNLEYNIEKSIDVNDNIDKKILKKDFDAIFLEKPTKIMVRSPKSTEEKLKGIFQIESLYINYNLSEKEYKSELKSLFNGQKKYSSVYEETEDSIEATMQIIIQAIGRLHRTNSNSDMFLFVDNKLTKILRKFANHEIPLLPSTLKLLNHYKDYSVKENSIKEKIFENELNRLTNELNQLINYSLKVFKDPISEENLSDMQKIWNGIRVFFLQNPTLKSIYDLNLKGYLNLNEICHIETNDKKYVCYQANNYKDISLNKKDNYSKVEISEEAANLHLIRNCPELNEFAIKNNIATTFKYNTLLIPNAFNNIYKGALGEVFGKYIIEKYCNINLEQLNGDIYEKFESFDFKYEKKGIYFDFKYYSQKSLNYSTKNIIDRSKYKLEINRLNKAVIVNIFAEAEIKAEISVLSHENVVVIPYLVNSKDKNKPYVDIKMIEIIREIIGC